MTRSRYSRSSRNWPAATSSSRLRLVAAITRTSTRACDVVRADGLDLAVLEKPQQQRLHAQAHLADFVEKQRAAMRELELAALVAVGAGEAALDVAEELRLEQRFGDAGAVDRHERRQPAAGVAVDVARDDVLADAALAGDQDLGGALRRPRGHGEQFRHGRAGDDEAWLLRGSTGTRGGR